MHITQTRDRSRLVRVVTVTIAVAFLFGSAITSALANHVGLAGSNFESEDGNLKIDNPAPHIDWETVAFASNTDEGSGSEDDSFGQGASEDTACPAVVSGSIPPNKSDLKSFGLFVEDGAFLHMFWTRVQDPKGTTNMDFEFNQNDPDEVPCSNGVTPVRAAGDALITYNLSKGGTVPSFFLHRWLTTGGNAKAECESNNSFPCWSEGVPLDPTGDATGSVNTVPIPAGDFGGPLDAFTFGEGSIDLSAVFPEGDCLNFGSAYLKSRSSDSFTSALKDFIAPLDFELQNCGSLKIIKTDDQIPPTLLSGAKFKVYKDDGDGIFEPGPVGDDPQIGSECTTTADGTGDCTFDDLLFGDYWVEETQAPAGHDPAGETLVTVDEPKTFEVTIVNARAPASVTVKKVDDSDPAVPLDGAIFTLFVDNGPDTGPPDGNGPNQDEHGTEDTNTNLSCTTNDAGTCTIENIFTTGGHWIVETFVPAGHSGAADQWVDISLGDDIDLTGTPFVNERLHTIIVLVCHSDGTLAESDVDNGSSSGTTIGSGDVTDDEEAFLCGLQDGDADGARFEDKEHSDKDLTVDVGSDAHS